MADDERPHPLSPGDRWITRREDGITVERTRTAANDGWEEVPLASDMPASLADAHRVIAQLHAELAAMRRRHPEERALTLAPPPGPGPAPAAAGPPATPRPCGGCGKKAP